MSWTRSLTATAVALVLSTTVSAVVVSQAPEPPKAAPGAEKLVGEWTGPYTTDGPMGTMLLTVSKAGDAWKVVSSLGGDAPPSGEPAEVKAVGNVLTWRQPIGEYDVTFKATLNTEGTAITGTLEATQGGAYVGGGSFTLNRKP